MSKMLSEDGEKLFRKRKDKRDKKTSTVEAKRE